MPKVTPKGELTKRVNEAQKKALEAVTNNVKASLSNDPEVALRMAAEKHKTGNLIVKRRNPGGGWAHFMKRDGVPLSEINPEELESLCAEEGGGGSYRVHVTIPGSKNDPIVLGPYEVIGRTLPEPKSQASSASQFPAWSPSSPIGNFLPGAASKLKEKSETLSPVVSQMMEAMQTYQSQLTETQTAAGDRQMQMMMMMMTQQQQASQQLMQVLAQTLSPHRETPNHQESEQIKVLNERLQRMEEERRRAELQELNRKMDDTKWSTLIESIKSSQQDRSNGMPELMAQIFAAQQNSSQQTSELMKEFMRMSNDKPSQVDQVAAVMSSMVGAASSNLELISKAMRDGLLGSTDSPIKEAIVRSIESAIDGLPELLRAVAGGSMVDQQQAYQQYVESQQLPGMPQPEALPQGPGQAPAAQLTSGTQTVSEATMPLQEEGMPTDSNLSGSPSPAATGQVSQDQTQFTEEDVAELKARMLSDDDMHRLLKDQALQSIVAAIQNGISAKEISARVWAHAQSPNRIAQVWFDDPAVVTQQVVLSFGVGDQARALAIAQDMMAFKAHIESGKDPNEWPDTGYRPVKIRQPEKEQDTNEVAQSVPQEDKDDQEVKAEDPETEVLKTASTGKRPEAINEGVEVVEVPEDSGIPQIKD